MPIGDDEFLRLPPGEQVHDRREQGAHRTKYQKIPPCTLLRLGHSVSSSMGFLCLGFLRALLGSMGLEAGTVPTRSRAIAFTSLLISKIFFLRGKHPPHGHGQHLRSERLVQEV